MPRDDTFVINTYAKFQMYTVPELLRSQFSIDRQLKVPIFTFVRERGSNFKVHLSNPQKAFPWRERRVMT